MMYKQKTANHGRVVDALKRLGNVARGYEIRNLCNFQEYNGCDTFEILHDLMNQGVVGKFKPNSKTAYWFLIPSVR